MLSETIQLEKLRQKIEDVEYESGDRSDYLDRGKPSAAEAKRAQARIAELNSQSQALKAELKQLIATVRSEEPQAFEEWINYHAGILQKIISEKETGTNAKTRKHVAKNTLQEWEKVRAGEQDYVGINWYFLKDYKASVRTFSEPGIKTRENKLKEESKSWWQFWK